MEQTAIDESLENNSMRSCCQVCGTMCLTYTACTDCSFECFFCDNCLQHNQEVLKGHSLLGHTLMPKMVPCTPKYKNNRCDRHGEQLRYYCENCKKQICPDCLLDPNCKWHNVMKMDVFLLKKKVCNIFILIILRLGK